MKKIERFILTVLKPFFGIMSFIKSIFTGLVRPIQSCLRFARNVALLILVLVIGYYAVAKFGDPEVAAKLGNVVTAVNEVVSTTVDSHANIPIIESKPDYDLVEGTWYPKVIELKATPANDNTTDHLTVTNIGQTAFNLLKVTFNDTVFMIDNYGNDFEFTSHTSSEVIHAIGKRHGLTYDTIVTYDKGLWSEATVPISITFDKTGKTGHGNMSYTEEIEGIPCIIVLSFELSRKMNEPVFGVKDDAQIISDFAKYSDTEERYEKILSIYYNKYCDRFGEEPVEIEKSVIDHIGDGLSWCIEGIANISSSAYYKVFGDDVEASENKESSVPKEDSKNISV